MSPNSFDYRSNRDNSGYVYAFMWLGSRVLLLGSASALIWMGILFITSVLGLLDLLRGLAIVAPCLGSGLILSIMVRRQTTGFDLEKSMSIIKKGFAGFSILVFFLSTVLGIYLYLSDPYQGHRHDLLLMSISPLPWLVTGVGIMIGRKNPY